MREVFFLIDANQNVLWSDASDSPVRLPDSRARWEAIWSRREQIAEIVHSHPVGPLAFSREDETTMAALVSALGKPLTFTVVAPNGMIRRVECEGPPFDEILGGPEPWWTALLRTASGMTRDKVVRPDPDGHGGRGESTTRKAGGEGGGSPRSGEPSAARRTAGYGAEPHEKEEIQ